MGTLHTEFTSDPKKLEASLDKLHREIVKLRDANAQLANQSRQASQQATEMHGQAAQAVNRWMTGISVTTLAYKGLQLGIQAANAELQKQLELQKRAADTQSDVAEVQARFILNLGPVAKAEQQRAIGEVKRLAAETGVKEKNIYQAVGEALSASAGNLPKSLSAVREAAGVAPFQAQETASIATGLIALSDVTGTSDMQANLGALLSTQQVFMGSKLQDIVEHVVPAAVGVKAAGDTAAGAFALPTAIGSTMKDTSGRISGTASLRLAGQLSEFLPGKIERGKLVEELQDQIGNAETKAEKRRAERKLADLKKQPIAESTEERIGLLQKDEKLARRFLSEASFEEKAKPAIKSLLTDATSIAAKSYAENLKLFVKPEEAAPLARQMAKGMRELPEQRQAAFRRSGEVIAEQIDLENLAGAQQSITRDVVGEAITSGKGGLLERMVHRAVSAGARVAGGLGFISPGEEIQAQAGVLQAQIGLRKGEIASLEARGLPTGEAREALERSQEQLQLLIEKTFPTLLEDAMRKANEPLLRALEQSGRGGERPPPARVQPATE